MPRSASAEPSRRSIDTTDAAHSTMADSLPQFSISSTRAVSSDTALPTYTFGQPGQLGEGRNTMDDGAGSGMQTTAEIALERLAKEAAEMKALGIDEDLNIHFDADGYDDRRTVAQRVEHFQTMLDKKKIRDGTQKTWDEQKVKRGAT